MTTSISAHLSCLTSIKSFLRKSIFKSITQPTVRPLIWFGCCLSTTFLSQQVWVKGGENKMKGIWGLGHWGGVSARPNGQERPQSSLTFCVCRSQTDNLAHSAGLRKPRSQRSSDSGSRDDASVLLFIRPPRTKRCGSSAADGPLLLFLSLSLI